jgi:ATP synthase protein I
VSDNNEDKLVDELRGAMRKDSARLARREPGSRTFWRSLGVLGMVGWPIALASIAGVLLGRWLDSHWHTRPQFTLLFLVVGVAIGCYTAWTSLSRKNGSAGPHR